MNFTLSFFCLIPRGIIINKFGPILFIIIFSYIYYFSESGAKHLIMENGNLVINPVNKDDEGIYTCIAQNIYGTAESQGRLFLMRKYP